RRRRPPTPRQSRSPSWAHLCAPGGYSCPPIRELCSTRPHATVCHLPPRRVRPGGAAPGRESATLRYAEGEPVDRDGAPAPPRRSELPLARPRSRLPRADVCSAGVVVHGRLAQGPLHGRVPGARRTHLVRMVERACLGSAATLVPLGTRLRPGAGEVS